MARRPRSRKHHAQPQARPPLRIRRVTSTDSLLICARSVRQMRLRRSARIVAVRLGQIEIQEKIARLKKLLLGSSKASWEERRSFEETRTNHANPFWAFVGRSAVMVFAPLEPAIPVGVLRWKFRSKYRPTRVCLVGSSSGCLLEPRAGTDFCSLWHVLGTVTHVGSPRAFRGQHRARTCSRVVPPLVEGA